MRTLSVLAVLLLASVCLLPLALADEDSLKVIVLLDESKYSVGSSAKVTVHVFDKAKHVDADSAPEVKVGVTAPRQVSVTRTSTGVYEGTFTLAASDLMGSLGMVQAAATYGKVGASDSAYNEATGYATFSSTASTGTGLTVDCTVKSLSDLTVKPGTVVTVEAKVAHNNTPVVPSSFSMRLSYDQRMAQPHHETLTTTNPAVGTYECTYTIGDPGYDTEFEFEATAEYNNDELSDEASVPLNYYMVVYHSISVKPTEAVFDLYVAGPNGKGVSGATVMLYYHASPGQGRDKSLDAGVTNSDGKVRVTLNCDNGTRQLYITGYANASGKSQSFEGEIPISEASPTAPTPSGDEFEAVYTGDDTVYRAGQTASREYILFNNSKLWTSKEVYCYIVSGTFSLQQMSFKPSSVEAKTMTTDSAGALKLSVETPSGKDMAYSVYFVSATGVHDKPGGQGMSDHDSLDGQSYSEDTDGFMSQKSATSGSIKVTVPKLNIGTPTDVRAEAKSDDPGTIGVTWLAGEFTDIYSVMEANLQWALWTDPTSYLSKKGGTYSGTVTIPEFMPKDQKYTIVVYEESSGSFPEYGAAVLKPGQGTAVQTEFPWLLVAAAVIGIVAVIGIAFLFMRRKGAAQPHPQPGAAPSGAAAAPPPPGAAPPMGPQASLAPGAPAQAAPLPATGAAQAAPPAGPSPPPAPQVTAVPPPPPLPPPAPSVTGPVTMAHNSICGYCNQWIMQGQPGVLCECGKAYHPTCARVIGQCPQCGKKLM